MRSPAPSRVQARAPVRINDIGGWTDTWFSGQGRVLNLAASPGVEVRVVRFPNPGPREKRVRIHAADLGTTFEMTPEAPDSEVHPLLQAAVAAAAVPGGVGLDIRIHASVPAGISVGTSAAVCVAVLGAVGGVLGRKAYPGEISVRAHRVETEMLGWQSGIQDQVCAAYGGVCDITMPEYPHWVVDRPVLSDCTLEALESRTFLVYLGASHRSTALHERVIASLEAGTTGRDALGRLRELPEKARRSLESGDLEAYGEVMILNNECQRSLHPGLISEAADAVIAAARAGGCAGWKVNGAGGRGGSLTVLGGQDPERRRVFGRAVAGIGRGIRILPVKLDRCGLVIEPGIPSGPEDETS